MDYIIQGIIMSWTPLSCPITSWQIDGETVETVTDFILGGAPKSLQIVIAAMKLKDTYS